MNSKERKEWKNTLQHLHFSEPQVGKYHSDRDYTVNKNSPRKFVDEKDNSLNVNRLFQRIFNRYKAKCI